MTSISIPFLFFLLISSLLSSTLAKELKLSDNGDGNSDLSLFGIPLKVHQNAEMLASEQVLEFPDIPIQLVRPDSTHSKLSIVKENMKYLMSLNEAVSVVAIVGKYHSGKSFFLNQLMRKQQQSHVGFKVGAFLQPETMGIWMWGKPMQMTLASGQNVAVVFLDTEGFASNNVSETYDAKIFAVSALLSSFLMYNSVKIIDQADLDYLDLLARRTQLFALSSQLSKAKWAHHDFNFDLLSFPPLLWIIQDFVQSLETEGKASDPAEWLQYLMKSKAWEDSDHHIGLLDIFPKVDCKTLFIPSVKKDILYDLSKAKEQDLTDEYKRDRDDVIKRVETSLIPKEKNGIACTGPELALLLDVLVTAANDGSFSEIPGRWSSFIDSLKQSTVQDCLKFYDAEMETLHVKHDHRPINADVLMSWHDKAVDKTNNLLQKVLFGLNDLLEETSNYLEQKIERTFEKTVDLNDKKIRLFCSDTRDIAEAKFETALSQFELPMRSREMRQAIDSMRKEHFRAFASQLGLFSNTQHFQDHREKLQNNWKNMEQSHQLKNNRAFEDLFIKAGERALNLYTEDTSYHGVEPRTSNEMSKISKMANQAAMTTFLSDTATGSGEQDYSLYKAKLMSDLKAAEDINSRQNEELLNRAAYKWVCILEDQLSRKISFIIFT